MTKQIILIFAVLCSVQVQANSRYTERDTVQHEFFHDATELFQPLQPVYLDGVVVPRTGSGNWFVSVTGGVTAFLGTPLGCEDLFGRVKPSYNLAVGKWFTPAVGVRTGADTLGTCPICRSRTDTQFLQQDFSFRLLIRYSGTISDFKTGKCSTGVLGDNNLTKI